MPSYVLKPRKDRDEYLIYSTIPDSPVSPVRDREGIINFLVNEYWNANTREEAEERIARADVRGMSWAWTDDRAWDDLVLVLNGPEGTDGQYNHRDMADVTRAYNAADIEALQKLRVTTWPPADEEDA